MANVLANDLDRVLMQTEGLWDDLRGARVFLTGGTGFFGSWLLETLLNAEARVKLGVSVVVLTRDPARFTTRLPHLARHTAVTLHEGDVRSFTFPSGAFSHVVHAAADPSPIVTRPDRERMFDTIVEGTRRVLHCARASGAGRFLFTSSGAVYGTQPVQMTHVSEEYAGAPSSTDAAQAYGQAKRAAEMLCAIHAGDGLQPTIARCFAFMGPYFPPGGHAAANFIRDALRGGPIQIAGDGTPYRSYLYGSDLAAWLWTILLRGVALRPYNVGSAAALTIRDLAEAIARSAGPGVEVNIARPASEGTAPSRYVPSVARAERELGLQALVPLDQAIQQTLAWHRSGVAA
jgi:dTDP-glucose 4,6-dehydratase